MENLMRLKLQTGISLVNHLFIIILRKLTQMSNLPGNQRSGTRSAYNKAPSIYNRPKVNAKTFSIC